MVAQKTVLGDLAAIFGLEDLVDIAGGQLDGAGFGAAAGIAQFAGRHETPVTCPPEVPSL